MRTVLMAGLLCGLLVGCGSPEPEPTPTPTPPKTAETAQEPVTPKDGAPEQANTIVDHLTGVAAVKQGEKIKQNIQEINDEQQKRIQEALEDE